MAVQRDDAVELFRKRQAQAIRHRRALGKAGEDDAFGMNVVVEPRLLDGAEDIILDKRQVRGVAPGEAELIFAIGAEADGAAQADGDEVASADAGGQAKDLLLVAAVAVKEHDE